MLLMLKVAIFIGGAGGIRTLDTAFQPYNGLANRRLQPLGHRSVAGPLARYPAASQDFPARGQCQGSRGCVASLFALGGFRRVFQLTSLPDCDGSRPARLDRR